MTTKKDWEALAEKELRGKPLEALTWDTLEGIQVKPLYTAEDTAEIDHMVRVGFTSRLDPYRHRRSQGNR